MRGDEIRDKILFLARFLRITVEQALEFVIRPDTRLHHFGQDVLFRMFRCNLQQTADMMRNQFADVFWRFDGDIITDTRTDQDFLHSRQCPCFPVQGNEFAVVGIQVLADLRINARQPAADALDFFVAASKTVHVRRRAAQIGNDSGEPVHVIADFLDLAEDRRF